MFGSMASPLLYSFNRPEIHKTQKRRLNMTNKKSILIRGLLIGTLLLPAGSAFAYDVKHDGDHHWRKNGKKNHHRNVEKNYIKQKVNNENRGHHNKPEIRQDFKDIGNARNEVKQDRRELHGDYQELRKDRAELQRDIRNGASKKEIFKDRQELRDDFKEIRKDRTELQQDQTRLDAARRELKSGLRK